MITIIYYSNKTSSFHSQKKILGTFSPSLYFHAYELEIGKYMFNYVHRSLPHYLSNIFIFTHDIHIHKTRQASHIRPFTSLTVKSSNSFLWKGPLIWKNVRWPSSKKNIKGFAVSLKTILENGYEELAWSLFNIKYLFICVCNYILVTVGSWYYYTFAIRVNWTFIIEYYCYVLNMYVLHVKLLL